MPALIMFDKMMGGVFRKADRRHTDQLVNRAKMLHRSTRALVSMAKAMLSARANGTDPLAAIEQTIGWQRLEALVEAMGQSLEAARADNLAEVIDSIPGYTGPRRSSSELSRSAHGSRPIPCSPPLTCCTSSMHPNSGSCRQGCRPHF